MNSSPNALIGKAGFWRALASLAPWSALSQVRRRGVAMHHLVAAVQTRIRGLEALYKLEPEPALPWQRQAHGCLTWQGCAGETAINPAGACGHSSAFRCWPWMISALSLCPPATESWRCHFRGRWADSALSPSRSAAWSLSCQRGLFTIRWGQNSCILPVPPVIRVPPDFPAAPFFPATTRSTATWQGSG